MDIAGEVALITGGAGGIGLAMAEALGRRPPYNSPPYNGTAYNGAAYEGDGRGGETGQDNAGRNNTGRNNAGRNNAGQNNTGQDEGRQGAARIALCDIDAKALAAASAQAQAWGIDHRSYLLDVTDPAAWRAVVARIEQDLGPVAILCNNAGRGLPSCPLTQLAPDAWRQAMAVNLDGIFHGLQAVVPQMVARGRGHVVNTGSVMGLFAKAGAGAYVASKFAVTGLSEVLRAELAPQGIGVSLLCPALVATPMQERSRMAQAATDPNRPQAAKAPLPRGCAPQRIGALVAAGIRDNRFYLLSHPEYGDILRHRAQALQAALGPRLDDYHEDPAYLASDAWGIF